MDIDHRELNRIFKNNQKAFSLSVDPIALIDLRTEIADYIREVRIKIVQDYSGTSYEGAENTVDSELDRTVSDEVL